MAPKDLIAKHRARAGSDRPENNPVIAAMMEILDASVGRVLARLDDMKADTGATADALNTLMGTSYDQALAQNDAAASALETSSALDDVTASLTNVPSGYKVALARFDAISADAANALAGLASAVTSATRRPWEQAARACSMTTVSASAVWPMLPSRSEWSAPRRTPFRAVRA